MVNHAPHIPLYRLLQIVGGILLAGVLLGWSFDAVVQLAWGWRQNSPTWSMAGAFTAGFVGLLLWGVSGLYRESR